MEAGAVKDRLRQPVRWDVQPLRSLLFAPGSEERKLQRVGSFGSDAIVLDLEDAVADSKKVQARRSVRSALPTYDATPVVSVRVNSEASGLLREDLEAIFCADLDCIMVPKVEDAGTLVRLDPLIRKLEEDQSLPVGTIRIIPIIETAKGLTRCEEIAGASPRIVTLSFGSVDFSLDIGFDITYGPELLYAQSRILVAARGEGLQPAVDGPYLNIHDLDGLRENTLYSRSLGFQGRVVVYPPQVAPTQEIYAALSPDEVARLRRIVETFEDAETAGAASIQTDGLFIDYPVYERAKTKLRLVELLADAAES